MLVNFYNLRFIMIFLYNSYIPTYNPYSSDKLLQHALLVAQHALSILFLLIYMWLLTVSTLHN